MLNNSNPSNSIKLIATDLDGTLLTDDKRIDPSFWEIFDLLTDQGVLFIAASGRQYYKLEEQFERVKDKIIFLAENGTFVRYRGEDLFVNDLDVESARNFVRRGREVRDADIILCGKQSAYIESDYAPFVKDASQYYKRLQRVDDLCQVDDSILKVTLWDHKNAETNSYTHFKAFEPDYKVAVAGDVWLDVTGRTASKGTAIERVQKIFSVGWDQTLIFGDYLNDLDMMGSGWYSYAMKNAHPKILEISRFTTRHDNNNNGVVDTIRELFGLNGNA
ncbi:MAG: HAD family hydrolase [Bacteroidales bacterium]